MFSDLNFLEDSKTKDPLEFVLSPILLLPLKTIIFMQNKPGVIEF
jgi:hypothetical protein